MTGKDALMEQVTANLSAVDALPEFSGNRLWLTFYLSAEPVRLEQLANALAAAGWRNTGDWEGAFLYPKIEVERTAAAILEIARWLQKLCEEHGVDLLNIDADTSPDVRVSRFVMLLQSDA